MDSLLTGTVFDVIDPMRHLESVIRVVEQLAEIGERELGESQASFVGHRYYLAILWGDVCLWDTEGSFRDDRDIPDDEGHEPSLELCCRILAEEGSRLKRAFSSHE